MEEENPRRTRPPLMRWRTEPVLQSVNREKGEIKVPRYKSGDIISSLVDEEINNYFHDDKFIRQKNRQKKKSSAVLETLKRLENERKLKILERELEKDREAMISIERTKNQSTKLEQRRNKMKKIERKKMVVVDHENAWNRFKLSIPEKKHLNHVRQRLNKKANIKSNKDVQKRYLKVTKGKKKAKVSNRERKIRRKKQIADLRSFLSGGRK